MIIENNTTYWIKRSETFIVVHNIIREDDTKIVLFGTHKDKIGCLISCLEYHLLKQDITHWEKVK